MCFFFFFFFENQHELLLEGFSYLQIPIHLNCSSAGCPNYLGFYGFDFFGQLPVICKDPKNLKIQKNCCLSENLGSLR